MRRRLWLFAPVLVLTVTGTALLGLSVAVAMPGSAAAPPFDEGSVIRSSFVIGRGIQAGNVPDEVTANYWMLVGADGEEKSMKATLTDETGALTQEGIRHRADGNASTYVRETGEVINTERPQGLSVVMWSQDSVKRELLDEGFELIGETVIAGVPAQVFEQKTDSHETPSGELFEVSGIDPKQVTGVVRRVYVGSQPFGVDLGEEGGYLLENGSEFIPYYRRVTAWEVLNEAPAGTFEWSPSVAGEVTR